MARKSLEMELLEASLRAARAWEKKKGDLRWKHEVFWPTIDSYTTGELKVDAAKELESGE
jgi:hypothetical protein